MCKMVTYLLSIILLSTIVLCCFSPTMHKQVMMLGADVVFVDESAEMFDSSTNISKEIDSPREKILNKNDDIPRSLKTSAVKQNVQTTVNKRQQPKSLNNTNTVEKTNKNTSFKQETPKSTKTKQISSEKEVMKPQQKVEQRESAQKPTVVRQLSEQEEIIAWNKWRSDLQNQVMQDTKIFAPLGTVFKFSFTVDKFGNLSNIKVWSTNPVYSETAVRVIKPVIASYQGKTILTFPQGTKRIITNVNGGFEMAASTGYSKPSDYSDYERVKK